MQTKFLTDMFVLGLPIAEKILRPIAVYIFLVAGLRLAGKRGHRSAAVARQICPVIAL